MSAAAPKGSSSNESTYARANKSLDKDGVRRAFRSFASALIVAARHAEKVAIAGGSVTPQISNTTSDKSKAGNNKNGKDPLDESVGMVIKQRHGFRRAVVILEGKLRGNAKESEALHCCLRSQPCVGGRKRKFNYFDDQNNGKES